MCRVRGEGRAQRGRTVPTTDARTSPVWNPTRMLTNPMSGERGSTWTALAADTASMANFATCAEAAGEVAGVRV